MMNDSTIISSIIYTFLAFTVLCITLVIFFYFSRKKIISNLLEKKEMEIKYQKDLIKATINSQEKERNRIAEELHDDISSKLGIISLNTHLLETSNLSESEAKDIRDNIISMVSNVMDSSRRIAHNLLPPTLDKFGLNAALEELFNEVISTKKTQIEYSNNLYFGNLEKEKNLHIFRILQELINNSLKHGKASQIKVVFVGIDNKNVCKYTDNGKGFDTNDNNLRKGLGLRNVKNRVELINGKLEIYSTPNKGVEIVFTF